MAGTNAAAGHTGRVKHRLHMWWTVLGLSAIGLIIGARLFLSYMNTPASAVRITDQPPHAAAPAASGNKSMLVSDGYARFTYPSFLTPLVEQQRPGSGSVKAAYGFEYKAPIPWQLTVTINYLPGGLAGNDSAYYAMAQNPARYQKTTETVNGSPVTVMTDMAAGGFSKIAFLFHGAYSADIGLSGTGQQDAGREQATLDEVIQSWHWQ